MFFENWRGQDILLSTVQCILFLLAAKCSGKASLPEQNYAVFLDQGGLWKVSSDVTALFAVVQNFFKTVTAVPTTKIDSEKMITKKLSNKKSNNF